MSNALLVTAVHMKMKLNELKINEVDSYWTAEEGLPCQQWFSDMGTEISLNLILPVKFLILKHALCVLLGTSDGLMQQGMLKF